MCGLLRELCWRSPGGRLREKRNREVPTKRGENLAEVQQQQAEQRHRNNRRDPHVRDLAQAASRIILPIGVRVRNHFQQEEKRNQGQRNRNRHRQPAAGPGTSSLRSTRDAQKPALHAL